MTRDADAATSTSGKFTGLRRHHQHQYQHQHIYEPKLFVTDVFYASSWHSIDTGNFLTVRKKTPRSTMSVSLPNLKGFSHFNQAFPSREVVLLSLQPCLLHLLQGTGQNGYPSIRTCLLITSIPQLPATSKDSPTYSGTNFTRSSCQVANLTLPATNFVFRYLNRLLTI